MVTYDVINSGSDGNAVVLNGSILIDCGVPYKAVSKYAGNLKQVLLTHTHCDHFTPSTIRRLAADRPTLRFGGGRWMIEPLLMAGVRKMNIDILDADHAYKFGFGTVIPFKLSHNVPNQGYKLHLPGGRVIYATDTGTLAGITAKDYDLYLVEADYEDEDIQERIRQKQKAGEYAYERNVLYNHLSKARCDNWISQNIGPTGQYIYMHQHRQEG
ncbi:MAG: MBL fold metallo-hydrolase [Lachnospiraceae bacterium]|nr:MBL fold metallo-hydrolase [Lachnospiraceae bacterium]